MAIKKGKGGGDRRRKWRNSEANEAIRRLGAPPNPSSVPITSSILAAVHANWISVAEEDRGFVLVRSNREDWMSRDRKRTSAPRKITITTLEIVES